MSRTPQSLGQAIRELEVVEGDHPQLRGRLDLWLTAQLPGLSRAKVQRLVSSGRVTVNGKVVKPKNAVHVGDIIKVYQPPPEVSPLTPVKMDLNILFEDEHIIVVDKPHGLSVHPGAGSLGPTLVQGLLFHVGNSGLGQSPRIVPREDPLAVMRPGIVHRLDKDTSGVMVCAKTDQAHAHLATQFQNKKKLVREYSALLDGILKSSEILHESWLARDPRTRVKFMSMPQQKEGARRAISLFRVEETFRDRLTLVGVRLFTGRTHQIRVHAKDLGAPIIGDLVYHKPTVLPLPFGAEAISTVKAISRQLLHARRLTFIHPISSVEMSFCSPYPADFKEVLNVLKRS